MGLDTSHGAYSAFNTFRKAVAHAIGGSVSPHEDKRLDYDRWYVTDKYTPSAYPGIYLFFNHSDCDGEFTPEECTLVANDLEQIWLDMKEEDFVKFNRGHIQQQGGVKVVLKKFIDGCRLAAYLNETLEFH